MFELKDRTIFLTLGGSQAHGTARDGSDVDLRGVCVAPMTTRLSFFESFEQYEGLLPDDLGALVLPKLQAHETASRGLDVKAECVVFDIAKFLRLAANANPNVLEIIFADPGDWLHATPAWRLLHEERHRFLTQKVQQTFLGYALAQLKKLKNHRARLLEPPLKKPAREDFGLPSDVGVLGRDDQNRIEQALANKVRTYSIHDITMPPAARIAVQEHMEAFQRDVLSTTDEALEEHLRAVASHALGLPPEVIQTLNAEKRYRASMKTWDSYQTWKRERNSDRAALERKHGYDTKHAMHLIRLMRMGLEVLQEGELHVRRNDSNELRAIRDGAWSFQDLLAASTELQEGMKRAVQTTTLAPTVDRTWVDQLGQKIINLT